MQITIRTYVINWVKVRYTRLTIVTSMKTVKNKIKYVSNTKVICSIIDQRYQISSVPRPSRSAFELPVQAFEMEKLRKKQRTMRVKHKTRLKCRQETNIWGIY